MLGGAIRLNFIVDLSKFPLISLLNLLIDKCEVYRISLDIDE